MRRSECVPLIRSGVGGQGVRLGVHESDHDTCHSVCVSVRFVAFFSVVAFFSYTAAMLGSAMRNASVCYKN